MRKPTPSLAISVAALVVALGGTGYAAATIDGGDIKNQHPDRQGCQERQPEGQGPQGRRDPEIPTATRWVLVNAAGARSRPSPAASRSRRPTASARLPASRCRPARSATSTSTPTSPSTTTPSSRPSRCRTMVEQSGRPARSPTARRPSPTPTRSSPGRSRRPAAPSPASSAARPTTTNDANHFVVSPRLSDGSSTDATNRKRFYIIITGDSSDYVAPEPRRTHG